MTNGLHMSNHLSLAGMQGDDFSFMYKLYDDS